MAASVNDKITDTRNAGRPVTTTASGSRSAGGTSLSCTSLTGWPTASKVHFITYQIDSNSNPVDGTQLDCYGIVSGSNIGSLVVVDGTDNGNSVGDIVEMLPTAAWGQDLADGLNVEHNRNGTHKSATVTSLKNDIIDLVYPVGSYYINETVSTNPATLLGHGTWTAVTDKFIVGHGSTYTSTGGAASVALTSANIPSLSLDSIALFKGGDSSTNGRVSANNTGGAGVLSGGTFTPTLTNGSQTNVATVPPYQAAYIWKRTA